VASSTLPLDKMTTSEKLRALEEIWDDLLRQSDDVPSPSWHADVLGARQKRHREGASQFEDWASAKDRLRSQRGILLKDWQSGPSASKCKGWR